MGAGSAPMLRELHMSKTRYHLCRQHTDTTAADICGNKTQYLYILPAKDEIRNEVSCLVRGWYSSVDLRRKNSACIENNQSLVTEALGPNLSFCLHMCEVGDGTYKSCTKRPVEDAEDAASYRSGRPIRSLIRSPIELRSRSTKSREDHSCALWYPEKILMKPDGAGFFFQPRPMPLIVANF